MQSIQFVICYQKIAEKNVFKNGLDTQKAPMFRYFNSHKDRRSPTRFDDKNIDTLLGCNIYAFLFSVDMMHSKVVMTCLLPDT